MTSAVVEISNISRNECLIGRKWCICLIPHKGSANPPKYIQSPFIVAFIMGLYLFSLFVYDVKWRGRFELLSLDYYVCTVSLSSGRSKQMFVLQD